MASYLREGDRSGLPSIRKHGFLDTQPSPRRITTIEHEYVHRVGSTSPAARMLASESSLHHPRPPSPNRRQMTEVRVSFKLNLLIINVNLCGIYFNDCSHVYDIMVNFEDFVYKANICKFQLMFLQWHSMRKVWYKYHILIIHICMQISCENSYICRSTFIWFDTSV